MPLPDYMSNPLFHMGLGLMSVPNQSYAPGAVSWGPGIQRGLLGYQQSLLYQDEQEERRQQQEFRQRKMEWEMQQQQAEQAQAAQAAEAQQAALRARGIPEEQIPLYLNNPSAMQSLFRAPPKATAFEEYAGLTPEQRQTYDRMKRAGATVNQINLPPGPQFRSTPGGGTDYLVPTGDPQQPYIRRPVIPGTTQETPEQKRTAADAAADRAIQRKTRAEEIQAGKAAEKAQSELAGELDRLDELSDKASGFGFVVGKELRERADKVRYGIAERMARVLEPTGKLTDDDIDRQMVKVPDPFGALDVFSYPGSMSELRRMFGIKEAGTSAAGEGGPPASQQQIDPSLLQQMDPRVVEILRRQGKI